MSGKEIIRILGGRMVSFTDCRYGEKPTTIGISRIDTIERSGKYFILHYASGDEIRLPFQRAKDYALYGYLIRHRYAKACVESVQRPSYIVRKINLTNCTDITGTLRESMKQMMKEREEKR